MDALETFIQEYSKAAAKPADPNDQLDVSQREDAVRMDAELVKNLGRKSGESPTARAAEKELGRKPDEPEDAAVEKSSTSNQEEAVVEDAPTDNQEEADVEEVAEYSEQPAAHAEPEAFNGEAIAAERASEFNSEGADTARAVADDNESAVPEPSLESDSEPANPEVNLEEFGEAAAIQNIFRDDREVQTNVQVNESSAMLEIIPIGIKDEIGHSLDNSINHQGETSFSADERDTPLPDFATFSDRLSSMEGTDESLSNLPFVASFSGRKRDQ
jgi:hypothetical protein